MSEEKIGKSSVSEGKSRKYKLTIGERLKDARVDFNKHKKQTIKEVSDATGIPQSTLSEIENDKREPGAGIIKKLAEHYGVSADFLLGLSDIRTSDVTAQAVIEYTGLSEKTVGALNSLAKGKINHLTEDGETINGNMPLLDCVDDFLRIAFRKDVYKFYIALRQNSVKFFGGTSIGYLDWENIIDGEAHWHINGMCEYACLKIGREVELALREKYYKEEQSGIVYMNADGKVIDDD